MSRIEELIKEKCPDGVEYKKLGGIGRVAMCKRIMKNETSDTGDVPFFKIGTFGGRADAYISNELFEKYTELYSYPKKGDILISAAGTIGRTVVFDGEPAYFQDSNIVWLEHDEKEVINSYLKYFYDTQPWKISTGGTIPRLYNGDICKIEIPVPPIEVQQEIVCILDRFTELEVGLQAEVDARKKQYQYYLDDYFDNQTENLRTLSEIGTLQRGKRFVHADAVEHGGVACIHYGELYTYYGVYTKNARSRIREELRNKMRYAHKGDVIIVGAGENNIDIGVGVVWDGDEDVAVHDACYTLMHQQNPKYISYFLRSSFYHNQIKRFVSEGKICSIAAEGIGRTIIPIPSLEEQNRIVKIFDAFETICNDKELGLQAEIPLRHKQYEYYRDKLLTFERKVV